MEKKKKSFGESLEAFFAGKGFYIVLFLCVAVIGVSAWSMLAGNGTDVDSEDDAGLTLSESPDPDAEAVGSITENDPVGDTPVQEVENVFVPEPPAVTEDEPVVQDEQQGGQETAQQSEPQAEPDPAVSSGYFIWPVSGEIENPYSMTSLIYNRTMADWRTHDGIDIAAALGDVVLAASTGTVTDVYADDMYGTTIVIDHGNGVTSTYSNLAETPPVSEGQVVSTGTIIGSVGDTALCEAGEVTHLHFSMTQDGSSVDPTTFLP